MSRTVDGGETNVIEDRRARRYAAAGRWATLGAVAFALAAGAALWASEGAQVFVNAAFSAVLACL